MIFSVCCHQIENDLRPIASDWLAPCPINSGWLMTRDTMFPMNLDGVLSSIDAEISRLQQARALLAGIITVGRGASTAKPHRKMSPAARKRIAAAQRKRWAEVKKIAR
jgi:hypothetical protein